MSKSYKRKKKWYDDDFDFRDNSQRINKERRRRKEASQRDEYDSEEHEEWPDDRTRNYPPRR